MTPQRRRFMMWGASPLRAIPAHPYRDTMLIYGAFGVALGVIGWAVGASGAHLALAGVVWVFAVAWSLLGWRRRIQASARGEGLH